MENGRVGRASGYWLPTRPGIWAFEMCLDPPVGGSRFLWPARFGPIMPAKTSIITLYGNRWVGSTISDPTHQGPTCLFEFIAKYTGVCMEYINIMPYHVVDP